MPVRVSTHSGQTEVQMLLDTGATYTMISRSVATQLGLTRHATSARLLTASGPLDVPLHAVHSLAVAGAEVSGGLAVAVCDNCANNAVSGLLGLNFLRHFELTIDDERRELRLTPKPRSADRTPDIRPFLALDAPRNAVTADGQPLLEITAHNRGPRAIFDLELLAQIGSSPNALPAATTTLDCLESGERQTVRLMLGRPSQPARYVIRLRSARW